MNDHVSPNWAVLYAKKKSVHDCLKHRSCARFDQLNKYLQRHYIYLVGQTGQKDAKPDKLYFTTTGCKNKNATLNSFDNL